MPRRELGSVYTPPAIAGRMARACLDRFLGAPDGSENQAASSTCRILDPACGEGAFLLEVFDELCRRCQLPTRVNDASHNRRDHLDGSGVRLAIVRDHIFGVDIDPLAVAALRKTLLKRIGASGKHVDEAVAVVEANIRHGDSLTGPDFNPTATPCASAQTPIDWLRDFPAAAADGGFDIIIGNPPYLRERNAKPLFDALAATDLGRRWREARMDLWYYFVHRSLDLLRPGGILSFIVNSYWMSSRGAGKMIERLRRETSFEEIVLLENARVFKAVAGRHMIFRLRKSSDLAPTFTIQSVLISRQGANPGTILDEYTVSREELFEHGRLVVARPDPGQVIFRDSPELGDWYDTRQGMAENPPAINRRLHHEFVENGDWLRAASENPHESSLPRGACPPFSTVGTGVFVLQADEVERLNLSAVERALLRPYYVTKAVGRYRITDEPTHHVLYLSRRTAPSLEGLSNIAAHLDPFRPILERRREVRTGRIAWWHLHWPRDEQIFVRPRVLCVQMGKRPQFVFAERPTFVGFSINLILPQAQAVFALDVLTGILNSDLALTWFDRHAKRRGINLEINAHLLRQFPLPGRDVEIERAIGPLVRDRQAVRDGPPQAVALEREIEACVQRLYEEHRSGV